LVNEISKINDYQVDKRDVETIVRGITNTTRVLHPGSSEYVSGDIAPLSTVEYFNNNNLKEEDVEDTTGDHFAFNYSDFKKHQKITPDMIRKLQKAGIKRVKIYKDQIKHEPFLTPAGIGAKAASSEDWIARLAHNRIRKVLEEGTTQGWRSEITETGHPLPQYIAGVNPK
jgi:L-rhamnose mutarotase